MATPTATPVWPRELGRYRVLRELGRGGMGVVLEAYDPSLDRRVALKLLDLDGSRRGAKRQLREAQALARLSHPNVVGVYEIGTIDELDFIAMELVEGESLSQWHGTPRPWTEVLDAYLQAGRGLAAAHERGLVHRDFKPSNCLIDRSGRVKVADFGLAGDEAELRRRSDEEGPPTKAPVDEPVEPGDPFGERLTRPGMVLGTAAYMSPEQRRGGTLDARSDQLSFCASVCEALFGRPALPAETGRRPRPREGPGSSPLPRVPRPVRRALARGLAPSPESRWPSMVELLRELERHRHPRRWRWAALLVGLNAAAIALAWGQGDDSRPCQDSSAQLRGTWDSERAAAIDRALRATELPYAEATATMARERLGRYAEEWVRVHTEACEAAHLRHELSLAGLERRMQCLDERRLALDHAVEQLLEADGEVVTQAIPLTTALPPVSPCADATALELLPWPPPARAEAVGALRSELDRARTRLEAGKYEEGLRLADAAVARAEALDFPPVRAEAALIRGHLRQALGRYEEAAEDLRAARSLALRYDHPTVAAEASTGLAFVVGVPLSEPRGALMVGESALALAQRVDAGGLREAEALVGIAQVMAKHGDDDGAEQRFTRALELLQARPDAPPLDLVGALDGLRMVLRRQGRLDEAARVAHEAVDRIEHDLGPEHPAMVHRLANLAAVLVEQERHAEAEEVLRRAIAVGERSLPRGHPALAHAHGNLGAVLLYRDRLDAATVELRLALELWQGVHDPDHDRVADTWVNLGVAARGLGRPEEAEGHYRHALSRYREVYGDDHPTVARVELNLGKVLQDLGRPDEAAASFERSREAAEQYGGPSHPDVAKALEAQGRLDHERGRFIAARAAQERALAIFEGSGSGRPTARLARALWALGRTELSLGELETAQARLERAREIQDEVQARPVDRARTSLALAELGWAQGQREQPRALVAQSLRELEGTDGEAARKLRDELQQWLEIRP